MALSKGEEGHVVHAQRPRLDSGNPGVGALHWRPAGTGHDDLSTELFLVQAAMSKLKTRQVLALIPEETCTVSLLFPLLSSHQYSATPRAPAEPPRSPLYSSAGSASASTAMEVPSVSSDSCPLPPPASRLRSWWRYSQTWSQSVC